MPTNLYYTSANDMGFKLMGIDTLYGLRTNTALEIEYRIKVGEINDLATNMNSKMNIMVNPDYVAPKELYRTTRGMGLNKSLELTWEFPVDSGFTYMARFHFCELDPNITNIGDMVFFTYIGSELAEDHADVISWSQKQKGLAVYKDYAILIPRMILIKRLPTNMQDYSEKCWPYNRLCQCFSLDEIKAATNNFDNTSVVGEGGFDHVYKGYIDDISIPVDIKHLKPGSKQGFEEVLAEIGMLS
ncbi:Receptor-like protein kinase FERONIA [Glycine max]|nr:Receptor-like protein kinase FERONIA [Glycine max]